MLLGLRLQCSRMLSPGADSRPQINLSRCISSLAFISPCVGSISRSQHSSITFTSRPWLPKHTQPASTHDSSLSQHARDASSKAWVARQGRDQYTREATLQNYKSRAAFKLLQINEKYKDLLRPGMTVVDLGFAPGSWSEVAINLVKPGLGRVVGVDLIPVQPPKGVNGIQGDFLSPETQQRVRDILRDEDVGKVRRNITADGEQGYVDRAHSEEPTAHEADASGDEKMIDVVLSDMMMNTSGNKFKDHAGSIDLCRSALYFAYDTLRIGGSFVCKFYQGAEDKQFERQLKAMFAKVSREKPDSSRSESKEAFFVAKKRLAKVNKSAVFDEKG